MKSLFIMFIVLLITSACVGTGVSTATKMSNDSVLDENIVISPHINMDSIVANTKESYILFDDDIYDFGVVDHKQNEVIHIEFDFKNKGYGALVVYKVDVSCNCLISNFSSKPIMTGQDGKILFEINMKNLPLGSFYKHAIVKSNAYNNYVLLKITGTIE